MRTYFNTVLNSYLPLLKQKILTLQNQKITAITANSFALLDLTFLILRHCFFKATSNNESKLAPQDIGEKERIKGNASLPLILFPSIKQDSPLQVSYLPYKVVVHMATSCLAPFLQATHDLIAPYDSNAISETSCINNLNALIVLFSGAAKAKQIAERLFYSSTVTLSVSLPNDEQWSYRVIGVFAGEFLLKFRHELPKNENTEENKNKTIKLLAQDIVKEWSYKIIDLFANKFSLKFRHELPNNENIESDFFNHTQPIIDRCLSMKEVTNAEIIHHLKNSWKKLDYSFNKKVLLSLRKDLNLNNNKTNENTSFVYYINLLQPISYVDTTNEQHNIYHAFLIEQFFHQRQSYHRIYSSWQDSITLLEFFQKKGYAKTNEGCLTSTQMIDFLNDFELLICESVENIDRGAIRQRLFGYASYMNPPILFFDDNSDVLKGLSLRYEACKIDPGACLKNFNEFIESKEYKKQFNDLSTPL